MSTDTPDETEPRRELLVDRQELLDHLDIIQELVVALDLDGTIVFINHNGSRLLGYSGDELIGRNWLETVIPTEGRERVEAVFADVLTGRHTQSAQWENEVITADGNLRRIAFQNTFLQSAHGRITGTLSSGIDVTELREKQRQLAEFGRRLSHATEMGILSEMGSELAHDINQPLSAIATYTDACARILDNDTPDLPGIKHALSKISEEARRAGDIVWQMRALGGKSSTQRRLLDFNALIRDLSEIIDADEIHNSVSISFDLEEPLPPVYGEPVQIQRVVLNFVQNAFDALGNIPIHEQHISIRTEIDGNMIRCSVADSGPGVADESVTELFDAFFTTKADTIGMGLAVCKTIIRHHEGEVSYQPSHGRGAVFSFTLPIAKEDPSHDGAELDEHR